MKLYKKTKSRAQTMVEFAMVLPILLMLVFGLFEVGRLAFVYSTIATASREAVRYGSATGKNLAETTLRYADCNGIREAAQKVDFLGVIDDENIIITYDHGPDDPKNPWSVGCQGGLIPPTSIISGDRINVNVSGKFIPIVNFIPLSERTLTSTNYHTLVGSVDIPRSWIGTNGGEGDTDVCPNMLGVQVSIPSGMKLDVDGNCVIETGTPDVCLNISGNQLTIPIGYIDDPINHGNCIINPDYADILDLCLNIIGIQSEDPRINNPIPSGLIRDEITGNCVSPPPTCTVTASTPHVDEYYQVFSWVFVNSIDTNIDKITVSWPDGSGDLKLVKVDEGANLLTSGPVSPETQVIDGKGYLLSAGTHTLDFIFENDPLSGAFQTTISFLKDCPAKGGSVILYPVTHSGNFPDAEPNKKVAGPWILDNHTGKNMTISNINITWGVTDCVYQPNLKSFKLGSISWAETNQNNNTFCNGKNISPPPGVTWNLVPGISEMVLTFDGKDVKGITVEIVAEGTGTSYIIESTNPLQNPNP